MAAEELTDLQILDLPDVSESEVSSETSSAVETPSQETEETTIRPDQAKAETVPAQKPGEKPQDKAQQLAKPTEQDAATFEQLFPAGIEQAREAHTKAQELDRADQAFLTSDYQGIAKTFEQMFGENPKACADAVWVGMKYLQDRAPEELSEVLRYAIGTELGGQKVWDALEQIYAAAQKSGAQEVAALADQLAGTFHRYGLGPAGQETQATAWSQYTGTADKVLGMEIEKGIRDAYGVQFSSLNPADQKELLKATHGAIQDSMRRDATIVQAMQKLRGAYSPEEGIKIFLDTIEPRTRALVPRVVQSLKAEYGDLFKQAPKIATPPARSQAKPESTEAPLGMDESRSMTISEILNSMRPIDRTAKIRQRPEKLSKQEARNMTFAQIINDDREVASQ